jgi:hypothetical protein
MFDVVTADANYDQALLAELGSMATLASRQKRARLVIRSM